MRHKSAREFTRAGSVAYAAGSRAASEGEGRTGTMKNERGNSDLLLRQAATMTIVMLGWLATARVAAAPVQVMSGPGAADVDVFEGPKLVGGPFPAYPASQKAEGKEGWVELGMMIDPKGKPYQVTVIDSSGNAALEQAAVKGADKF